MRRPVFHGVSTLSVLIGAGIALCACQASSATPAGEVVGEAAPDTERAPSTPVEPRIVTGSVVFSDKELAFLLEHSPLPPVPDDPTNSVYRDPAAARLGQALFFDARFSSSGDVSCSTCHSPDRGWSDGRQLSLGQVQLDRHSMTLWNVAYNRWFFWDGRADSLWAQALRPLEDAREHASSRLTIAHLLYEDADLRGAYEGIFEPMPDLNDGTRFPAAGRPVPEDPGHPDAEAWAGMTAADREAVDRVFVGVGKSIAAFERQIVTRRAPFDVFVEGVREADAEKQRSLPDAARRGFKLFAGKARCHLCHVGPAFTDKEFHNNRIPPLEGRTSMDAGRFRGVELVQQDPFNGIGAYSDAPQGPAHDKVGFLQRSGHNWGEFKTPSLRNVAVTAPYLHEGQFATLEQLLQFYSTLADATPPHHVSEKLLVAVNLAEEEIADLLAFLESLTDVTLAPELKRALTPAETAPRPQ